MFPNVPTFAEQGFSAPIYKMNAGWIGIIAPTGTPSVALQKLGAEYSAAIHTREVMDKLAVLGLDPIGADAQTFAATYQRERPVWRELLQKAGVELRS